ncbi:MAG: TIR domain-containing protein, partial [Oscillospiraceae bacterium]|nr:TIR domain-containing protein [Oscillospiraceae bacterium]
MLYDAFISYRHGELDGVVAERLHKMLETYRIPNSIAKKLGRKQLGRVFRDREELPTSANLSDSINEALENSEFLLLICSKRTRESRWVMRELEQFGELRGKDKIITLLIDGEPSESFPPNLWERDIDGEVHLVEPLAADIRADSWAKSLTLLKEEKLRLLATILGCSFDDLRRRHQRRKIQQTGLIVGAIFAITLAFGTLTTTQYLQINRQMQLKLENQSYVLAEYSDAKLADGDRDLAVLLALEALPDGGIMSSRPFVPVAQRALADALGVYDVTSGYKPHKAVTLPAAPLKIALSPSGKFAAALYPFEVTVFDTETGRKSVNLPSVHSILSDAEFLSDSVIVFTGGTGVNAYNISTGEPVWIGEAATLIAVSEDKTRIAAVYRDCGKAIMYSAE